MAFRDLRKMCFFHKLLFAAIAIRAGVVRIKKPLLSQERQEK